MPAATAQMKPYEPLKKVTTTVYAFPTMEPIRFAKYPAKHLYLPLRRDILHRAVIFEGDRARRGTASTKNRWEIRGSKRKIRPQKGTGKARLGTRQAPHLRGGAKWNGPKPRDFSTDLPRKIYNLAWRTALSYRYRRGTLIVCENDLNLPSTKPEYTEAVIKYNNWGKENGSVLLITTSKRDPLFELMDTVGNWKIREVKDVDVKNLLEPRRVFIEQDALGQILSQHS